MEGQRTNTLEEEEELFRARDEKWLSSGKEYHFHTVCCLFIRENKHLMRRREETETDEEGGEEQSVKLIFN